MNLGSLPSTSTRRQARVADRAEREKLPCRVRISRHLERAASRAACTEARLPRDIVALCLWLKFSDFLQLNKDWMVQAMLC
jgi:hypothetical protein